MATIKEVAEKAGVSAATVSYVLNDSRKVRPETEQRVLWAAKELGYFPNTAARSLAVGRSSILGLIVADMSNPFYPEIARNFQLEARLYGLEALVMDGNKDPRRARVSWSSAAWPPRCSRNRLPHLAGGYAGEGIRGKKGDLRGIPRLRIRRPEELQYLD